MDPLRVLVADDHPLFRHGITVLLHATPDLEAVGEATTGEEAVRLAADLQPDVLLMDIQMPGVNGIEATRRVLRNSPEVRVLVVTMFEDEVSVFAAMRAGARGYILKDAEKAEILRAIRAVGSGEAIFSSSVATQLIDYFGREHSAVPKELFPALTEREREILQLVAQGYTNPQIALELGLSQKTVKNYVSSIFTKLQVADRSEAIARARGAGLP